MIVLFEEQSGSWWSHRDGWVMKYYPVEATRYRRQDFPDVLSGKWLITTYLSDLSDNSWISRVTDRFENPLEIQWMDCGKTSTHGAWYCDVGKRGEPLRRMTDVVELVDGFAYSKEFERFKLLAMMPAPRDFAGM